MVGQVEPCEPIWAALTTAYWGLEGAGGLLETTHVLSQNGTGNNA